MELAFKILVSEKFHENRCLRLSPQSVYTETQRSAMAQGPKGTRELTQGGQGKANTQTCRKHTAGQ